LATQRVQVLRRDEKIKEYKPKTAEKCEPMRSKAEE
jgi:hypothetical protein